LAGALDVLALKAVQLDADGGTEQAGAGIIEEIVGDAAAFSAGSSVWFASNRCVDVTVRATRDALRVASTRRSSSSASWHAHLFR